MSLKILVCGDINGHFRLLFDRVRELLATKGHFDSIYCVGNFFGPDLTEYEELRSGKIRVPILTYIVTGDQPNTKELMQKLELSVTNIAFLGKMGLLTDTSGLKIAYLSGIDLPEKLREDKLKVAETFSRYTSYHSKRVVKRMVNTIRSPVDILLTAQWPKDVANYGVSLTDEDISKIKAVSSISVSYVAKYLKPRYHFSAMAGVYYERVPYRNHVELLEKPMHCTRFFGLGQAKKGKIEDNRKWMYAFYIVPQCSVTSEQLLQCAGPATVSPYGDMIDAVDVEKNFFFDASVNTNNQPSNSKKRAIEDDSGNRAKKPAIDASTCWFCLSNEKVEKQLIITVGNYCYITLAKGYLVEDHVMIVPIDHTASSVELSPEAFDEVEKFKEALINYYSDRFRDVVFFERNYRSPHLQIQAVPVPRYLRDEVEDKIYSYAYNFDVTAMPTLSNIKDLTPGKSGNYFYIELVAQKKSDKYLAFIESNFKDFPLQIGRQILADVLDAKDRVNWQECVRPLAEEEMAAALRSRFKKYDFTQK